MFAAMAAAPCDVDCSVAGLENENDLRQFLKVVRPDWSCPRKKGHSDIQRVIKKLKDIGVYDTRELVRRVSNNSINEDLSDAGYQRFCKETVESIRKQSHFIRALDHLKEPYFRQVGLFAPVPQLLAGTNLRQKAEKLGRTSGSESEGSAAKLGEGTRRPATSDPGVGGRFRRPQEGLDEPMRPRTSSSAEFYGSTGYESEGSQTSTLNLRQNSKPGRHAKVLPPRSLQPMSPVPARSRLGSTLDSRGPVSSQDLGAMGSSSDAGGNGTAERRPSPCGSAEPGSDVQSRGRTTSAGGGSLPSSPSHRYYHKSSTFSGGSPPKSPPSGFVDAQLTTPFGTVPRSPALSWHMEVDDVDFEMMTMKPLPMPFIQKWAKVGDKIKQEQWVAKWGSGHSLLSNGDAMLREQTALDERKALSRSMSLEGVNSPLRSHVSSKIRSRLLEEKERDAQGVIDVQQRCMNIRKNLGFLQAARRDLSEQKRKAQDIIEGPRAKTEPTTSLTSCEMFKRAKSQTRGYKEDQHLVVANENG